MPSLSSWNLPLQDLLEASPNTSLTSPPQRVLFRKVQGSSPRSYRLHKIYIIKLWKKFVKTQPVTFMIFPRKQHFHGHKHLWKVDFKIARTAVNRKQASYPQTPSSGRQQNPSSTFQTLIKHIKYSSDLPVKYQPREARTQLFHFCYISANGLHLRSAQLPDNYLHWTSAGEIRAGEVQI